MDNIIVMKFGGSSLSNADHIKHVASLVTEKQLSGKKVVVVVSAMGKTTDTLLKEARAIANEHNPRELDMLLTAGERISASLLSIAIHALNCKSISLTGSQAGIITDDNHTNARIIEIRPHRVLTALQEGNIVIVGGFQGVSFKKEVTTLGRGGSDTSAVALASALKAQECEIYSDVDGIYAADPNIIKNPGKINELSYQEMQELSESGAKVLHPGAIEFAKINNTIIRCKSTFKSGGSSTIIKNLDGRIKPRIVGIATEEKVLLVHMFEHNSIEMSSVDHILNFFNKKCIKVKQLSFHRGHKQNMVGSFIIPEKENYNIDSILKEMKKCFKSIVDIYRDYGAISLVGSGITAKQDFLITSLDILKKNNIETASFHTSSFRISFLVERSKLEDVSKSFYKTFIRS